MGQGRAAPTTLRLRTCPAGRLTIRVRVVFVPSKHGMAHSPASTTVAFKR